MGWFEKRLAKADDLLVFGVPVTSMDREELLASLVTLQELADRDRETHRKDMDTLSMLRRASRG